MMSRWSVPALRACLALAVVLCTSCARLPVAGHGSEPPPERSVGRPGCGLPISYQVFRKDAFGADWSKANDLLAYTAKGGECSELSATHHRFAGVEPVGQVHRVCRREIGSPGRLGGRYPGLGSYSDLSVASGDGSHAWQLIDVPTDKNHGTIIPEFSPDGRLLEWTERTKAPRVLNPDRFAGFWVIKVADWWTMTPDGSNPQRLSNFNAGDNAKVFGEKPVRATVVQTADRTPDNSSCYGDVETNLVAGYRPMPPILRISPRW
jgi:hypothetical protein